MAARIVEMEQRGFFLTDHGVLTGFSEIQRAAKKQGLVAIPGVEFYVAIRGIDDRSARDTAHLTVWAHNLEGYRNLCRLHTESFVRGYYYDPRVDFDMLAAHSEGLMASTGCLGGILPKALVVGDKDEAERRLNSLAQIFDKRLWVEVQNHGIPEEAEVYPALLAMAKKYRLPIVASTDAHYTERGDWIPHDALVCLRTGSKMSDNDRKIAYVPEQFALQSEDEMLAKHEAAHVYESGRILDMCDDIDISSKIFHLPEFCESPESKLRSLAVRGLKSRYGAEPSNQVKERLEYELEAICKAGFANYLLIVWDIYKFARRENIAAGAGRGSAAGSIVCYCIGITNIDPMQYDLMFERFIDPNRVSQPDIDADFSALNRGRIIDYIKERWGSDRVSQIVAFQTFGGRAAPRDIARVLGKPLELGDKIAKMIPQEGSVTREREERHLVRDALENISDFKALYDTSSGAREVVDLAMKLEGVLKTPSLHAAGIVVADKPLGEYCPMITVEAGKKEGRLLATGYEMNELENIGLIKIDILGIKYLDTLRLTFDLAKRDGVIADDFNPEDIDIRHRSIYELLSAGRTAGVFQAEGSGMTKLMRDLKPSTMEDIALCISVFRPGPISQIGSLVRCKRGDEDIEYPHELLEPILSETYGKTIYQEQILKIAQVIAGFSITRADQLRKVIGKKIVEKMPAEKKDFIAGAIAQGHDKKWATDLFKNLIEPAAKYAFGRSHAFSYADLTARTAWAKANLTKYFFAALLTGAESHANRAEKMSAYIADARSMGIAILPPDINISGESFTPVPHERAVRFGLNGIKNVGTKAVAEIVKKRKKEPFCDLFSTVERIKSTLVNSRCIESLICAGAFDSMPGNRSAKMASIDAAIQRAEAIQEDARRVAAGGNPVRRKKTIPEPILAECDEDLDKTLPLEREIIGYYLSNHPYRQYADKIQGTLSLQEAWTLGDDNHLSVGGIVSRLTVHTTKRSGLKMLFGTIEDESTLLDFVVFPRQYETVSPYLTLDAPAILSGRISIEDADDEGIARPKIIVDSARRIGKGVKRKEEDSVIKLVLAPDDYRRQLAELRERLKAHDEEPAGALIVLPNEKTVRVLA